MLRDSSILSHRKLVAKLWLRSNPLMSHGRRCAPQPVHDADMPHIPRHTPTREAVSLVGDLGRVRDEVAFLKISDLAVMLLAEEKMLDLSAGRAVTRSKPTRIFTTLTTMGSVLLFS